MSRKPIESFHIAGIKYACCQESDVRELEAELDQLQNTIHNIDYSKCPDCEGYGQSIKGWTIMPCKKCKGTGQIV